MNAPLPFQQFQYDFARHIRAPREFSRPQGVAERPTRIYRDLVRDNLASFLDACFPVSRRILGEKRWKKLARIFFAEWRSHTPYFREIPREFLRWLMECEAPVALPPFLIELAHYEWAELAVDVMETSAIDVDGRGDLLQGRPVVNPALMNLSYQWPVHRIGPDCRPRKSRPVQLLVYRKADDKVAFTEINPVSARLVALLQAGTLSGHEALLAIAAELPQLNAQSVVANGTALLHDLRQEDIILGTAK